MTALERSVLSGDMARARAILEARARSKAEAKRRRKTRAPLAPGCTKDERDAAWSGFVGWVHDVVWRLSSDRCEHCGRTLLRAEGEMDHARGGAYRRECTRIDYCRRLCARCHPMRTATRTPKGEVSAAYWSDHMESVRQRRDAEHTPETMAALRETEARMLAELDPLRKRASVPVKIEVADGD